MVQMPGNCHEDKIHLTKLNHIEYATIKHTLASK